MRTVLCVHINFLQDKEHILLSTNQIKMLNICNILDGSFEPPS